MSLRPEYRLGGEIVLRPSAPVHDHPRERPRSTFATNYRRAQYRQSTRPTYERAVWLDALDAKINNARAEARALDAAARTATNKRRARLDRAIRKRWERIALGKSR